MSATAKTRRLRAFARNSANNAGGEQGDAKPTTARERRKQPLDIAPERGCHRPKPPQLQRLGPQMLWRPHRPDVHRQVHQDRNGVDGDEGQRLSQPRRLPDARQRRRGRERPHEDAREMKGHHRRSGEHQPRRQPAAKPQTILVQRQQPHVKRKSHRRGRRPHAVEGEFGAVVDQKRVRGDDQRREGMRPLPAEQQGDRQQRRESDHAARQRGHDATARLHPEEQLPRPHEQIPGRRLCAEGFQMLETHQLRHAHALSVDAQDFVAPQRPPGDSAGQHAQHDADQGKGRCRNQRLSIARARSRVDTGGFHVS